ncbi:hypothetical protein CI105_06595 [Candidatus Izimaplasma bacterium ZiA1]|uniref:putative bifunctional diguanylate cyclase/phosphodiesterase n=1 Tax=Candidatus Izimoplasma sp. ZiA1 TaxID=2024899 RepID=UPI000BAA6C9F|nr:hypothetical protein CI105_06595 [Candidatus Izimaplasma bacterium ZiA1]
MKKSDLFTRNRLYITVLTMGTILWFVTIFLYVSASSKSHDQLVNLEKLRAEDFYIKVLNDITADIEKLEIFTNSTIGNIDIQERLEVFYDEIDGENKGIVNVSIAIDGIQTYVSPYDANLSVVGHNLYTDERDFVRASVFVTIISGEIEISGPYELRQGGEAVVLRKAVYINDVLYGIMNYVIDNDYIQTEFDKLESDIVHVVIQDGETLIYGSHYHKSYVLSNRELKVDGLDWDIIICENEAYKNNYLITTSVFGVISVVIYLTSVFLGYIYYRKNNQLFESITRLNNYDSLTGLPNRVFLSKHIEELIAKKEPFFLGFGDLNNFKNLNDILGHTIGDRYLKDISNRFHELSNDYLSIYRWGGDEFIFVIKKQFRHEAVMEMEKIYETFKDPIELYGNDYYVSMSTGLVNYPAHGIVLDDLIKRADIVMYDVKKNKQIRYSFFEDKYLNNLQREVDFENKVNQYTIDDFEVYLQPIVDVKSGIIKGFEALTRLFDKEGNLIDISEIIKIYERKGQIHLLDKNTFEKACEYYHELMDKYDTEFSFSFNISPLTLTNELVSYLRNYVKKSKINPSKFVIEIIETTGFKNIDDSIDLLNRIKEVGFTIAMDDFGMGYSSLSYITRLPLSAIKIDRKFIHNYATNEFDRLLILTVKEISNSLNLEIIVEGIETPQQLDFIKQIGCHYYQGYYHSKPMSISKIHEFLSKYN